MNSDDFIPIQSTRAEPEMPLAFSRRSGHKEAIAP
jgi:hypothetical protein